MRGSHHRQGQGLEEGTLDRPDAKLHLVCFCWTWGVGSKISEKEQWWVLFLYLSTTLEASHTERLPFQASSKESHRHYWIQGCWQVQASSPGKNRLMEDFEPFDRRRQMSAKILFVDIKSIWEMAMRTRSSNIYIEDFESHRKTFKLAIHNRERVGDGFSLVRAALTSITIRFFMFFHKPYVWKCVSYIVSATCHALFSKFAVSQTAMLGNSKSESPTIKKIALQLRCGWKRCGRGHWLPPLQCRRQDRAEAQTNALTARPNGESSVKALAATGWFDQTNIVSRAANSSAVLQCFANGLQRDLDENIEAQISRSQWPATRVTQARTCWWKYLDSR